MTSALEDLGPADAFVTLQERARRSAGFPPRPRRFGPQLGGPSDVRHCAPDAHFAEHRFTFSDRGRLFDVDVVFGRRASGTTRAHAWAILDGLRVSPPAGG